MSRVPHSPLMTLTVVPGYSFSKPALMALKSSSPEVSHGMNSLTSPLTPLRLSNSFLPVEPPESPAAPASLLGGGLGSGLAGGFAGRGLLSSLLTARRGTSGGGFGSLCGARIGDRIRPRRFSRGGALGNTADAGGNRRRLLTAAARGRQPHQQRAKQGHRADFLLHHIPSFLSRSQKAAGGRLSVCPAGAPLSAFIIAAPRPVGNPRFLRMDNRFLSKGASRLSPRCRCARSPR